MARRCLEIQRHLDRGSKRVSSNPSRFMEGYEEILTKS